jgi:predicted methyltransferase
MSRKDLRFSSALGWICLIVAAAGSSPSHAAGVEAELTALAAGDHRAAGNADRNEYRHPVETLLFFGIEPDMTVVEMTPGGGGWYTEIIAPFLRDSGRYYAANYDPLSPVEYYRRNARTFVDKLAENLELYDQTIVTVFAPPNKMDIAPPGSADLVVTFRNTHNWLGVEDGAADAAFSSMYRTLKPGGVLGVVKMWSSRWPRLPVSGSTPAARSMPTRRTRKTTPKASGRCRRICGLVTRTATSTLRSVRAIE